MPVQLIRRMANWVASRLTSWGALSLDVQLVLIGIVGWGVLQAYGRLLATSEVKDLIALAASAFLGAALYRELHERNPALGLRAEELLAGAWVSLKARLSAEVPRVGADLVRRPPYPAGLPRLFLVPGLAAAAGGLFFLARPFGDGLRLIEFARDWAYPAYLAAVGTYWTLTLIVGLMGLLLPIMMIRSWAHGLYRAHDERRDLTARRGMAAAGAGILLAILLIPAGWAPILCALLALVPIVLLHHPHQPTLSILWRPSDLSARHRSMEWRTLVILQDLVVIGVCMMLMTVPGVGALTEEQREAAPISAALRWLASIGGLMVAATLATQRVHFAIHTSLRAPSKPTPRRIRVEGGTATVRAIAEDRLRQDGWKTLGPEDADQRADDTRLQVDSELEPESPHFVDLTRAVAPAMLSDKEVLWRLKRRADIRSRRSVMKGLKAVFKEAAASLRGPGTGYVVAPHQWFMRGLARDIADHDMTEGRSAEGFLQPEYGAVMTPRARHHLYLVLSAVGVDLIYVEDGVGYRRLAQALRVIFELFDRHGVDRRVTSRDFSTVHGVHAILHDVSPDDPRESELYPEPDYASETRARILHLYRDRGGDEEVSDAPVELDDIPLLV